MSAEPTTPLNLQRFLPYRLSTLSNKISQSLAKLYSKRFDISIPEWRILAVLGQGTNLSAVQIAGLTAMDKVAVSRAVKRLLEKGHISKIQDDSDNRRFELSLSEQGQALYKEVVPLAMEYERRLLAGLSAQEIDNMDKLLNMLDQVVLK
ncbi:MarR family transcriptional regulator [Aliiglaciecola sp. CAU 1673]|uniref:MarR family winged helix-turn-helix transcriptional regulator n=1 Tax=Aliiglaciecola sp. CAU 1673 TaxID=3032595 RepID=UPI0023DA4A69|nr:MarR family transcriptional regulator [Aliiglaciecola sp. CAU 1673]MDF2179051.1 MarR family transcriptional regulator [Aliiglaciecola sp. CAU 1673]